MNIVQNATKGNQESTIIELKFTWDVINSRIQYAQQNIEPMMQSTKWIKSLRGKG